jgi:hypothetical protein
MKVKLTQVRNFFCTIVISLVISILLFPFLIFAQAAPLPFTPLVSIPGLQNATDLNAYINALYSLSISIAALIAVVKIVLAGAKYMLDDLVSGKQQAKTDIWNALIGLLIIIGAWLILNTINSDLTNPSILIERVDNSVAGGAQNETIPIVSVPLNLNDATTNEVQNYISACTSQLGNYQYTTFSLGGILYGTCENKGGTVTTSLVLENPDDIAGFADICANEGTMVTYTPLPSGDTLGRCLQCLGSQVFDEGTGMCRTNDIVCQDESNIMTCSDITFGENGDITINEQRDPEVSSAVFSCNYTDIETRTKCMEYCYDNDGGASTDTCVIPDFYENQNLSINIGGNEPALADRENITTIPNTVYKIDDPAYGTDPAGPLHNKTVTFTNDAMYMKIKYMVS